MKLDLNILLKVILASSQEQLITHALKLQLYQGIDIKIPESIMVEINESTLVKGKRFKKGTYGRYGYVRCKVISFDKYKIDYNYLVAYPNGTEDWVKYHSSIQDKEEAEIIGEDEIEKTNE